MSSEWSAQHFVRFHATVRTIDLVRQLGISGAQRVRRDVAEQIAEYSRMSAEAEKGSKEYGRATETLDRLTELADFISSQESSDFHHLNAQALVGVWGVLDALVHDLLLATIDRARHLLKADITGRMQIKYAEYMSLESDDLAERLLTDIGRQVSSESKLGVAGFESQLDAFQLSGSVDERVNRVLLEASQIRNVMVHRSGIADRRLCRLCPWLDLRPGNPISVGTGQFTRYLDAIREYVELLQDRFLQKFTLGGADPR